MSPNYDDLCASIASGGVLTPTSPGYEESILRWSAASIHRAAVVVQAANADEVAVAVNFAVQNSIPLTVHGGGHSTAGASSIEDGMVIDLRRINDISINTKAQTVKIGGGCRWREVDAATAKFGLATIGGTVNDTGVGGFTCGGGYGFLSPKYGLTIDNLIEVETVLANGNIVTASKNENEDLFWAVRGAGSHFGVITSFTLQMYPIGEVWGGLMVFTLDKLPQIVEFANDFHKTTSGEECFFFGCGGGLCGREPGIMALMFKDGTQEEGETFFRGLAEIGPVANLTRQMPYKEMNQLLKGREEPMRRLQGGSNFTAPLDATVVKNIFAEMLEFLNSNGLGPECMIVYEFFPYGKVNSVKNSDTAFASRGNYYHAQLLWSWDNPELDKLIRAENRNLADKMKAKACQGMARQYNNYDGGGSDPESAFGDNLPRLRDLKAKYDPHNIFKKWNSIV